MRLPTSSANALLEQAGGVLFAARIGRTKASALRRAVERVGEQRSLGVALVDAAA
jgi:hypothetical protein